MSVYPFRSNSIDQFASRLFRAQNNRQEFDQLLGRVLFPVPKWNIEQADTGQYYLKYDAGGMHHNSEGLGDGLISLLFIVDALYDSGDNDMIVIDEPELSLHPSLQRKLSSLLIEYSSIRQIVVATHSPYFLELPTLEAGARVARVHQTTAGSVISELTVETGKSFQGFLNDTHNPHVWGLNAKEVFFLDDGIILVEGQDDVIHYPRLAIKLGIQFQGTFFGWGVGGAQKMKLIAKTLKELGFQKVAGILDRNCDQISKELQKEFPDYSFFTIPANDVRTKKASPAKPEIIGLTDEYENIRPEYSESFKKLVQKINSIVAPQLT
ncbi:AAA family ATPase [uncultured Nitrospira sp.]|uniref:ATP-dependent nuclease n=1 Tax=uncultured Nitrospira sp. TaxID=157176 RepID=UPI00313FF1C1